MLSDIAVDSHVNLTVVRVLLRKAKNDPFGKGVNIFLGRVEGSPLCPVAAVLLFGRHCLVHFSFMKTVPRCQGAPLLAR